MRIYEELFIVKPDAPEEEVDALISQLETLIRDAGGTIDKVERWGARRLAYAVAKHSEGQYILIQFQAKAGLITEMERRLRVSDLVLKFITVRIDEKLKWLEKRRKIREKRAQRKPAPAHAPEEPAAAMPGKPSAGEEQTEER